MIVAVVIPALDAKGFQIIGQRSVDEAVHSRVLELYLEVLGSF
jgi:hypothetical protein